MSVQWDRPVRFTGSPAQAAANRNSHRWVQPAPDETYQCMDCDAKTWHAAADYPCGTEVPREVVILRASTLPDPRRRRDLDD